MRLARKNEVVTNMATDPRQYEGGEIIDLSSRRVLPQVMQNKPRSDAATLITGVVLTCALGAVTFWSLNSSRTEQRSDVVRNEIPHAAPMAPPLMPVHGPVMIPPQAITNMVPTPMGAPAPVGSVQTQAAPATNTATAPTLVFDSAAFGSPAPGIGAAAPTGAGRDDFAASLGVAGTGPAKAAVSIDPKTTIAQGTLIPAVLETAINTDLPGYARAVVSADVRSFDGTRVLLPRSTRLIGQYKSGIEAGQKRAYVMWIRVIRPDGVSVDLGSPAIDFSGQTGLAGKVNGHFFERFGSAMLLSVIGGLSALGNTAAVITGGGQSAAAAAVGQTGKIAPTVQVGQGEPIRVFTARDLDFSRVQNN